jgi:hypothetical protein
MVARLIAAVRLRQVSVSSTEWTFQGPAAVYHEDGAFSHMKLDMLLHRNYMYARQKLVLLNAAARIDQRVASCMTILTCRDLLPLTCC